MAFVVEDGTMPAGANSYSDVAEADDWATDIGNTDWLALTDADKKSNLITGTEYVNSGLLWVYLGSRQTGMQALEWPRTGAYYWGGTPTIPESFIPREVKKATWVAADMARAGTLPTLPGTSTGGGSNVKREKVDVIEIEYFSPKDMNSTGSAGVPGAEALAAYGDPAISGILMPLLNQEALTSSQDASTAVSRTQAARRTGWYLPQPSIPSFDKGMADAVPLAEDAIMVARAKAMRERFS